VWYTGHCPRGDQCSRGGRQLCCKPTRDEAVQHVAWHLHTSTYHNMPLDDAKLEADSDHFISEIELENPTESDPHDEGKGKSKGRGKGKGKRREQHQDGWPAEEDTRVALRSRSPPSVKVRVGQLQNLTDALDRAISASDHAANISRSAAKVFDDQAATLRQTQTLLNNILIMRT